jgi:hypothetical protein
MIRLHIIAEGQTEEAFVNRLLVNHLGAFDISTDVHCVTTNRKLKKRGGAVSYEKIKQDICLWLRQDKDPHSRFTTMLDLYALPPEFPEFEEARKKSDPYERIGFLENAFFKDIKDERFIPYFQLHEFEALILSDPNQLSGRFPEYQKEIQKLITLCSAFSSPELINDNPETAPSKRINQFIPGYKNAKVSVAPLMAEQIGLENIRGKCPHFNEWLTQLEQLSVGNL